VIGRRSLDRPSDSLAPSERPAEPGGVPAPPAVPPSGLGSSVSTGPTDSDAAKQEDGAVVASEARHRRLRRVLLPAGVFVILAGCGIGAWLLTRGSSSTANMAAANRLFNEGLQAQIRGQPAIAANDYLRSVTINPENKIAWYDLGLIQQEAGNNSQAEIYYERSSALDPRYVPPLYNLGTLVAPRSPASAAKLYEKVIAVEPMFAQAHLDLGFALQALGQRAQGNAQIAEAVRLDPSLSSRVPSSSTTTAPGTP
jgi:tetratricopeptide (TPR) repeat protein